MTGDRRGTQRIETIPSSIRLNHALSVALAMGLAGCSLAISTDGLSGGDEVQSPSDRAPNSTTTSPTSPEDADNAPKGSSNAQTPPTPPSNSEAACSGASFEGRCYFLLGSGTFEASRAGCEAKGAHIVTITSAGEQAFVAAMVSESVWIGLTAKTATNDPQAFAWITGEARTVAFWYPGQPNGSHRHAVMHHSNREWRDVTETNTYPAVCERD